jgi:hypothetical protein
MPLPSWRTEEPRAHNVPATRPSGRITGRLTKVPIRRPS